MKKLSLFLILLTGCATFRGPVDYEVKEDIYYTPQKIERQMGDLYLPETKSQKKAPIVIVVHGGGWTSGSKFTMFMVAQSLASNGIAVFNINYRLAPAHTHPAGINDIKKAYEFIVSHADKYGIDKNRIGLWGYSAGGHMVSYMALATSKAESNKYPIKAVVSGGGAYDLTWYTHSPYAYEYLSGYRDKRLQEYIEASPVNHISKKAPPFLLYHALKDRLVTHGQAASFELKLKQKGVAVERVDIEYWSHDKLLAYSHQANRAGVEFLKRKLN